MIDVFLWQWLETRARGDMGAAVSEHACPNNTELHLRHNINTRQITQQGPALMSERIVVRHC